MHFRHISAKSQPKYLKQHFDWRVRAPWAPPSYAVAPELDCRSENINYCTNTIFDDFENFISILDFSFHSLAGMISISFNYLMCFSWFVVENI